MPILLILFGIFFYIYLEISLLVSVSASLGVFPTILLLIAISVLGVWFVKLRGFYAANSIRQQLAQGKAPTEALLNSITFAIAGVLLLIPGFLSDIFALLCVLPFTRKWIQNQLRRRFQAKSPFAHFSFGSSRFNQHSRPDDSNTFDAEFERQQDQDKWIK